MCSALASYDTSSQRCGVVPLGRKPLMAPALRSEHALKEHVVIRACDHPHRRGGGLSRHKVELELRLTFEGVVL